MTLSKEKLAHYAMHTDGPVKAMARELLERRGRDKQEPDGWQFLGVNGLWVSVTENGMREALKEGCEVRPLYAAPQLPQPAVVIDVTRKDFEAWARAAGFNEDWYFFTNVHPNHYDDDHINDMWAAWNACRAAMLQGAEPASQTCTLPDGWVAVPVDMTPEQMRAVQINSELGAYAASNLSGAYSLLREFWGVAVKSVPNQEVK